MKSLLHVILSLFLLISAGCSKQDTAEVSGIITWDGSPVPHGDIVFVSLDPHIPAAAGKIIEGKFKFRTKPGEKRVEIRSFRLSGKKTRQGRPIGEMYIPNRYNDASELKADVTLDGPYQFDFALKR